MKKWIAALLALLLMNLSVMPALAGAAEQEWQLFDMISYMTGPDAVKNADLVMQRNLYTGTVNGMEFTVTEAGYDGRSLFLRYSYRIPDAGEAFGVKAEEIYGEYLPAGMRADSFVEGLTDEGSACAAANDIGWWHDQFWLDGRGANLASGASQSLSGSSLPGEIIETDYLPLGKMGIFLEGPVQVSLPIGPRPDGAASDPESHPELYDADGSLKLPEEGVVTFELDTKNILSKVKTFHPEQEADLSSFTAKVGEAAFSPMMTYITVEMDIKPGALEAYVAENGEGEKTEDGELIYRYGPIDIVTPWLESLQLVDGNGTALFPEQGGLTENDDRTAEFLFPYIETLPESLYLAPYDMDAGQADMTRAIPVL